MKSFNLFILLSVLFVTSHAFAQAPCPCDELELSNGNTGAEIIDILCPGGNLAAGNEFELTPDQVVVVRPGGEKLELSYGVFIEGDAMACEIFEDTVGGDVNKLSEEDYEICRSSLIARCGLLSRDIPTLSEWGMIATAGILGMIGLYAAARRRKAAA
ncbi:MAG TPA: IPTL-CTERM sorting domain-containing protein [Thermodesulfobacteriota bacterium]|nr:IPTL-CTERM sorting domain-containing protein [Thermodesulfobacteriota bacterium]